MNLRDYLRASDAAAFAEVSPGTVRNWERQGRLRARRLAHNGYQLLLRDPSLAPGGGGGTAA